MTRPEHRGGRADPERDGAPARRPEPLEVAQGAAPVGAIEVDQGVHRQRPGAGRREFEERRRERRGQHPQPGRQDERVAGGSGDDRRAGEQVVALGRQAGPRPSSPSAARQRAAASSLPNAATRAASASGDGRVAAPRGRRDARRRRDAERAQDRRAALGERGTRFDRPHDGSQTTGGPGPSTIALGSHGVPGGVTSATKPSPSASGPTASGGGRREPGGTGAAIAANVMERLRQRRQRITERLERLVRDAGADLARARRGVQHAGGDLRRDVQLDDEPGVDPDRRARRSRAP